jgi:hypothetical protein
VTSLADGYATASSTIAIVGSMVGVAAGYASLSTPATIVCHGNGTSQGYASLATPAAVLQSGAGTAEGYGSLDSFAAIVLGAAGSGSGYASETGQGAIAVEAAGTANGVASAQAQAAAIVSGSGTSHGYASVAGIGGTIVSAPGASNGYASIECPRYKFSDYPGGYFGRRAGVSRLFDRVDSCDRLFERLNTVRSFRRMADDVARLFERSTADVSRLYARAADDAARLFGRDYVTRLFRGFLNGTPSMATTIDFDQNVKDSSEVVSYLFDFTNFPEAVAGETLSNPVVDSVSGLTIGSPAITVADRDGVTAGKGLEVTISGGTAGDSYQLEARADFSGGATRVVKGLLYVE